jgi:hypothetical protein
MNDIFSLLILLGVPTAFTGFCFWLLKRHIDKKEKEREEHEKARKKNELLLVQAVFASIGLGEATALALKNGHTNGETEAALEYARQIKHAQKDFLTEQGINNIYFGG